MILSYPFKRIYLPVSVHFSELCGGRNGWLSLGRYVAPLSHINPGVYHLPVHTPHSTLHINYSALGRHHWICIYLLMATTLCVDFSSGNSLIRC
jgi:hypothetical protein